MHIVYVAQNSFSIFDEKSVTYGTILTINLVCVLYSPTYIGSPIQALMIGIEGNSSQNKNFLWGHVHLALT